MCDERPADRPDLPSPRIADDRSPDAGEAVPVHIRRFFALAFVAAHEDDHIVGARVGEGDAGVSGTTDGSRDAGNDLEVDALFPQEQGLFTAAVEHKRIAPFEPD